MSAEKVTENKKSPLSEKMEEVSQRKIGENLKRYHDLLVTMERFPEAKKVDRLIKNLTNMYPTVILTISRAELIAEKLIKEKGGKAKD